MIKLFLVVMVVVFSLTTANAQIAPLPSVQWGTNQPNMASNTIVVKPLGIGVDNTAMLQAVENAAISAGGRIIYLAYSSATNQYLINGTVTIGTKNRWIWGNDVCAIGPGFFNAKPTYQLNGVCGPEGTHEVLNQAGGDTTFIDSSRFIMSHSNPRFVGDHFTMQTNDYSVQTDFTFTSIKVDSATVAAAGTGGTPGACTLTGTTGRDYKFQATGTVDGSGNLTGAITIVDAGAYTVGPTDTSAEPVTADLTCGLVGAKLNLTMLTDPVAGEEVGIDWAWNTAPSYTFRYVIQSGDTTADIAVGVANCMSSEPSADRCVNTPSLAGAWPRLLANGALFQASVTRTGETPSPQSNIIFFDIPANLSSCPTPVSSASVTVKLALHGTASCVHRDIDLSVKYFRNNPLWSPQALDAVGQITWQDTTGVGSGTYSSAEITIRVETGNGVNTTSKMTFSVAGGQSTGNPVNLMTLHGGSGAEEDSPYVSFMHNRISNCDGANEFTACGPGTFGQSAGGIIVTGASVVSGGTGGLDGACTVTGTTGTGQKFTASGTVTGNTLAGNLTIVYAGVYSTQPTDLSVEPVTGCSLTGATLLITISGNDNQGGITAFHTSNRAGLRTRNLTGNGLIQMSGKAGFTSSFVFEEGNLSKWLIRRGTANDFTIVNGVTGAVIFQGLQESTHAGKVIIGGGDGKTVTLIDPLIAGSPITIALSDGELGWQKITASGVAPGAAGIKESWVCGTNAGSAKKIAYAGTSATPTTLIDNVGSGVTGC